MVQVPPLAESDPVVDVNRRAAGVQNRTFVKRREGMGGKDKPALPTNSLVSLPSVYSTHHYSYGTAIATGAAGAMSAMKRLACRTAVP